MVKIHASSVNRTDDGFLRAKPWIVRGFSGITKPRRTILGCEFAGTIEEVGADVSKYKLGDKVFGVKRGLFPIPKNNKEIIEFLRDRVEDGSFKPVIDRTYTLEQIVEAFNYVESGQKTGNVVITIKHG